MADDSGGNHSLPPGYFAVTGEKVLPSNHNPPLEDLSASMTARVMRDGRAPMTGNLQMGSNRITGLAPGIASSDAATFGQIVTVSFNDIPDGTAAAPALSFTSDPDTGIWRVGANEIGFSTDGDNRVTIDNDGMTVHGNITVEGAIEGGITFGGNIDGDLTVSGTLTVGSLVVNGNLVVTGTITAGS